MVSQYYDPACRRQAHLEPLYAYSFASELSLSDHDVVSRLAVTRARLTATSMAKQFQVVRFYPSLTSPATG
jgi:hypothetical protein